jgi:hypothetical protein
MKERDKEDVRVDKIKEENVKGMREEMNKRFKKEDKKEGIVMNMRKKGKKEDKKDKGDKNKIREWMEVG